MFIFSRKTVSILKHSGAFNVFQINPAKCWLKGFYDVNKFIRVFFVDLNIKTIDAAYFLNNTAFPSITGFGRFPGQCFRGQARQCHW